MKQVRNISEKQPVLPFGNHAPVNVFACLVLIALNRSHVSAIMLGRNEASRGRECETCTQARPPRDACQIQGAEAI